MNIFITTVADSVLEVPANSSYTQNSEALMLTKVLVSFVIQKVRNNCSLLMVTKSYPTQPTAISNPLDIRFLPLKFVSESYIRSHSLTSGLNYGQQAFKGRKVL